MEALTSEGSSVGRSGKGYDASEAFQSSPILLGNEWVYTYNDTAVDLVEFRFDS